jgi:hypothetical protein
MQICTNLNITITATTHAQERIAQRAVCPEALALVSLHGFDCPAGRGCFQRELRDSQINDLYEQGFALAVIEKALRLRVIYSGEEELITCYKRKQRQASRGAYRSRKTQRRTIPGWRL